ncbi:MAG: mycothiol synthase [Acidobacteriota bacterium]|nr:mycothiol synthase [Acidobacteriota bacterium]MDE3031033.1 mycothiol synthase [Acidobacteriota bacterium]MDE3092281.1 mycothiol synthase [Acidobacteriota bacterium]MDE3138883.1 mycothiol synthase [Acidobacteriota bacterium]MDE3146083.1 mycothiol synthase [Acidobacteriota bacterium]
MDISWQRTMALSAPERLQVLNLINRTEANLGREALDETRRRTVVHGWRGEHWLRCEGSEVVQYALVQGQEHATLEMCGGGFDSTLLDLVLEEHEVVDWWTRDSDGSFENVVRTLQLMTINLPVPVADVPADAVVRNFDAGIDDAAWLAQNNAAFADHPEQGAWRLDDLEERIREPWFDPSGFLVLEIDGRIAASCWTKVHELHPERFGEIYVISVDPAFQGRGLGRVMLTRGLQYLRQRGVHRAVLFVDADNLSAQSLYRSLGFSVEREDQLLRFARD